MDSGHEWRATFRPDIPSSARIYDYLLGGKDNYPADRHAAQIIATDLPNAPQAARWNRAFLRRVVTYLVREAGVRQIIDIGAGLPGADNTHEVAFQACPETRVVYVDHDPVVLAHGRDMLHAVPGTAIIEADLHSPEAILADPELADLIDFSEPVAILLLSVMHFVGDQADPAGIVARLHGPFPPGSHVAISHATPDAAPAITAAARVFDRATEPAHPRTRTEIAKLATGLELVPPGLVWTPEWRPDPTAPIPSNPQDAYYCALLARKP